MFKTPIKLTQRQYQEYVNDDEGICLDCGETQGGCEPDAREYTCESCDEEKVIAFEQALIEGLIVFIDKDEDHA